MPVPEKLELKSGKFRLSNSFKISVSGNPHLRLYGGATRMLRRLDGKTGLVFTQDVISKNNSDADATFSISVKRPGKVVLQEDETYQLSITQQKVELTAESDLGALHGLETLLQLVSADETGYYFPAVSISDKPRFPWRGLLIDVARHFMPVDVVKRNIDGLAAVKMNVLHWHLSEDQGFRVESKTFPKLHQLGSDGLYYTQEQIRDVLQYAEDRGIRVVPEFDIPGHATSWFVGYPELASAPGPYTIERKFGVKNPTFNPTKEETYEFMDAFFKEMTALFPDEYMHIGGDENNGKQWKANTQIQEYMKVNNIKDNHALQSYFNERILKILTKYNKKMVGWDEILQPGITKSIVIQSWRGKKSLYKAAEQGYPAILSNGYYIDLAWSTDRHYLNDPIPADAAVSEEQRKMILGGEATMWSELATEETIDSRIWPRTAAIAERLWSPGQVKDVEDMYRRLAKMNITLEEVGLTHLKNQDMLLRRLTNSQQISALKHLVDVLEPVEDYKRHGKGNILTSYGPYTLIVDAANPDATVAREFRNLVSQYVAKPSEKGANQIKEWLSLWKNNYPALLSTINHSPVLKEAEPLAKNLADVSQLGLEALEYLSTNKKPAATWIEKANKTIEESKKFVAKCELRIVPGVENLVKMASKQ